MTHTRQRRPIEIRLREMLTDVYGLLDSSTTDRELGRLRSAMQTIAWDDGFWDDMKRLYAFQRNSRVLVQSLTRPQKLRVDPKKQ